MPDLSSLFWALTYPGGREFVEPGERLSIRGAAAGADRLTIIQISENRRYDRGYVSLTGIMPVPVVYRVRSLGLTEGQPHDDAFVFGRATRDGERFSLWAFTPDQSAASVLTPGSPLIDAPAVLGIAGVLG